MKESFFQILHKTTEYHDYWVENGSQKIDVVCLETKVKHFLFLYLQGDFMDHLVY